MSWFIEIVCKTHEKVVRRLGPMTEKEKDKSLRVAATFDHPDSQYITRAVTETTPGMN